MHKNNQENHEEYKNMKYKKDNIVLQLFTMYLNFLKSKKKIKN